MLKQINEKYSNIKLLNDELLNDKLFDNHSFQYILDRELHRRSKSEDVKENPNIKIILSKKRDLLWELWFQ